MRRPRDRSFFGVRRTDDAFPLRGHDGPLDDTAYGTDEVAAKIDGCGTDAVAGQRTFMLLFFWMGVGHGDRHRGPGDPAAGGAHRGSPAPRLHWKCEQPYRREKISE